MQFFVNTVNNIDLNTLTVHFFFQFVYIIFIFTNKGYKITVVDPILHITGVVLTADVQLWGGWRKWREGEGRGAEGREGEGRGGKVDLWFKLSEIVLDLVCVFVRLS